MIHARCPAFDFGTDRYITEKNNVCEDDDHAT
jgi:hypothetical protein